ncbi:MAG: ribonuclease D [Cardiobacteriales bacterium]|nr:MAG: ribonuclease D [Cardiobacteriales bacterium]
MKKQYYTFGENPAGFSPRFISYDSEFVREKSYIPKLALIQLHQSDAQSAQLYDPLSEDNTPPWSSILEHQAPIVMHSGSQDLELMHLVTGQLPRSYRDTQLGFALIQPEQFASYATLIKHYLGISLNKEHTRSNWLKRPLTPAQLSYAADDVYYLSQVYPLLCADLQRLGRLEWWQEECERLLKQTTNNKSAYQWHRLSNASQLKGIETAIADILVGIREQLAAKQDLPRRHIAHDKLIITIAKARPITIEALADVLPANHILWTALAELTQRFAKLAKQTAYPTIPRAPRLSYQAHKYYRSLLKHTQQCAKTLNIAADMLITAKQLKQYCAQPDADSLLTKGWRAPLYANLLK